MCGIAELIAPVLGAPSIRLVVRVDPECPGHVPPVSVRRIARALDADCITDLSQCVQCPIVRLMPARVVLWARVKPIAHTHNVAQPEMFHVHLTSAQPMFHVDLTSAPRFLCVGSLLVQNESTLLIPCIPKWGGGGNPMSIGPATPNNALSLATLNVRRLWLQDESVHDGFRMLCASEL